MGPFVRAGPWFRRGGACPVFAGVETGSGFSHFVTSMTAPIAAGWSGVSGGPCTYWKAPPFHGADQGGHFP